MLPKSSECIATDQSNDPKRTLKIDELRKGCSNENEMTMILGKIIESDDLEYALRFFDSSKEIWHAERRCTLHPEYEKLPAYNRKSTFCISRTDYINPDSSAGRRNRQLRTNAEGDR